MQLSRSDLTWLNTSLSWLLLRVLQNLLYCLTTRYYVLWHALTCCSSVADTRCSEAANSILITYWKIYEWLSFITLKSRFSCNIHAVEAQEVCECQDASLNWSIHTTELWLQHLPNTSAKTVLSTRMNISRSKSKNYRELTKWENIWNFMHEHFELFIQLDDKSLSCDSNI